MLLDSFEDGRVEVEGGSGGETGAEEGNGRGYQLCPCGCLPTAAILDVEETSVLGHRERGRAWHEGEGQERIWVV